MKTETNSTTQRPHERRTQTRIRYHISHRSHFTYSAPVTFDELIVRLQPRSSYDQQLRSFSVECSPSPSRHTHCTDLHGNIRNWFWFAEQHCELTLLTRSVVDCFVCNPFDFTIIDGGVETLPAVYAEPVNVSSAHYRYRSTPQPQVDAYAREIMRSVDHQTVPFLVELATRLKNEIRYAVRRFGAPYSPTKTLELGEGACRDTAVLFMDACRSVGLAARFVSGYAWDAEDPTQRDLHAWAEVYLPGAGWRGFDATTGLAVSNRHIAVAASPTPSYTAPTDGTFSGPRVESELTWEITMEQKDVPRTHDDSAVAYQWP